MIKIRPILIDFPETIESQRLIIRGLKHGEGAMMNAAIVESLPELNRWVGWVHPVPTPEDSEEFVRTAISNWLLRKLTTLAIFTKDSGRFVGCTGFHAIDWDIGKFETGYWVRSSEAGKGYITEAMRAATKFAFEHLKARRLEIRCDAENLKSKAIPERLGFKLEGRFAEFNKRFDDNSLGEQLVYARTHIEGL
jgi:RimJ/RimL family protein N-acetyltransferase